MKERLIKGTTAHKQPNNKDEEQSGNKANNKGADGSMDTIRRRTSGRKTKETWKYAANGNANRKPVHKILVGVLTILKRMKTSLPAAIFQPLAMDKVTSIHRV